MSLILALLLFLLLVPGSAHAYIDPGAGSILLQGLIAAAVGGWLAFRVFASNLWRKLRGGREREDVIAAEDTDGPDDETFR